MVTSHLTYVCTHKLNDLFTRLTLQVFVCTHRLNDRSFCSAVHEDCFMYSVHSQLSALISLVTSLLQLAFLLPSLSSCKWNKASAAARCAFFLLSRSLHSAYIVFCTCVYKVSYRDCKEVYPPLIAALNFWGTFSITTSCLRKYKYSVGLVEIVNFKRLQKKCAECPAVTEFRRRSAEHLGTKLVVTSKTNPMPRTSLPSNSRQNRFSETLGLCFRFRSLSRKTILYLSRAHLRALMIHSTAYTGWETNIPQSRKFNHE